MSKIGEYVLEKQEKEMLGSWTEDGFEREAHRPPTKLEMHRASAESKQPTMKLYARTEE